MIKIKDWAELNLVKNKNFTISLGPDSIRVIEMHSGFTRMVMKLDEFTKEEILGVLKAIGFDIEFIEPRIYTTEEKAFAVAYKSGWVARDNDIYNTINIHKHKPTRRTDDGFWKSDDSNMVYNIPQGHFLWLTFDDEPLDLSEVK